MKKPLYIIVLTICFILELVGKSYGQDLKIIDEESTILNSIKINNHFYSVEIDTSMTFFINGTKNISFSKRNLAGSVIKRIQIGVFFQYTPWLDNSKIPCNFYKIIPGDNNDFFISFVNGIPNSFDGVFKIVQIKETNNFDTLTIFADSTQYRGFHWNGSLLHDQYDTRNVIKMDNNEFIFKKSNYIESDSSYHPLLLKVDLQGNVVIIDTLHASNPYNYNVSIFKNYDSLYVLEHTTNRINNRTDSSVILKYNETYHRTEVKKIASTSGSTYPFMFFLKNNEIYNVSFHFDCLSSWLHTVGSVCTTNHNNFDDVGSFATHNLNKPISEYNQLLSYTGYGFNGSNKISFMRTQPYSEKFQNDVIPYNLTMRYRGADHQAGAVISTYASSENDTCFYVFGNIIFFDHYYKSLMFVKKVCSTNKVISGNVFADFDYDCSKDSADRGMNEIIVTDKTNNFITYTTTDKNGNYVINDIDTGYNFIEARANINYPYFAQDSCSQIRIRTNLDTTKNINLSLKPIINCPYLTVDVGTSHCGSLHGYQIKYCNNGTEDAHNAYIDLQVDQALQILNTPTSSIPYISLGNSKYRFQLGTVEYAICKTITFTLEASYSHIPLGQTICSEAHIYPDSLCITPAYNGPFIQASAFCLGDTVLFKLKNIGRGNMNSIKHYIVIEDNVNRLRGDFQLPAAGEKDVYIATRNGASYTIIAEQPDEVPPMYKTRFAAAHIEACLLTSLDSIHAGFITQFPAYDGEPYRSVDCWINRSSYDPNDKTGFPFGYGTEHYIEKNTDIDYLIRFQNTGNDTAYQVYLIDTISPNLDINTIQPGVSSHNYEFQRIDSNVIKFNFPNIKLVDSIHNELLSHGFVKFRIQQKANNPNGTKIYNTAEIYFDYNSPIFTNKTMHTIGDVYVRIISKVINPTYSKADIKIYPNPFRDKTTIELQNIEVQKTSLVLIDITGKEILQLQSNNNQYEINGNDLAKGMYLFQIKNDKGEIANGKLIVQ